MDEHSRSIARTEAQATIDAASAALGRGSIDDAEWQRRVTNALARAYLRESDPRWQSGFDGDGARMNERAAHLIATLGLRPHPEGGYYREIFRSRDEVTPANGRGPRSALTTIYFLLVEGMHSQWHQVASDEAWHLYEGGPLELLELDASASVLSRHRLEPLGDGWGAPVHVVPSGSWQAARPLGPYALVGCTVGPGFDFADFRMLRDDHELSSIVRSRFADLVELI